MFFFEDLDTPMTKKNYQSILPEYQPLVSRTYSQPADENDEERFLDGYNDDEYYHNHHSKAGNADSWSISSMLLLTTTILFFLFGMFQLYSRVNDADRAIAISSSLTVPLNNQHVIASESKSLGITSQTNNAKMDESTHTAGSGIKSSLLLPPVAVDDCFLDQSDEWKRRILDVWGPFWEETKIHWNEYKETILGNHNDKDSNNKTLPLLEKTREWWHTVATETAEWWNATLHTTGRWVGEEKSKTGIWWNETTDKEGAWLENAKEETTNKSGIWIEDGKQKTLEWWNQTEIELDDGKHKSSEWFNETEQKTAGWIQDEQHKSSEWWNETEHKTASWLSDEEQKSAEWLQGSEHKAGQWINEEKEKSSEWFNNTEHVAGEWLRDEEHKSATWLNKAGNKTEGWLTDEEDKSAVWFNETGHVIGEWWNNEEQKDKQWLQNAEHKTTEWVKAEEQHVGGWWNDTEHKTVSWVDNLIKDTVEHTVDWWNASEQKTEDWWYNVTHHHVEHPEFVIYMNSTDAYRMLTVGGILDFAQDYFLIQQGYDAQINQAYCAVATSAAILNSLRDHIKELPMDPMYNPYPYATQPDMFNHCTNSHVIRRNSTFDGILASPFGLGMSQTKALLECHLDTSKWNVTAHHLDPSVISIDEFRRDLQESLVNSKSRVIINFDRKGAGQVGGGHFSPIGAFSPDMDAFLVMDVAKYKYPNAWISTTLLYKSLQTFDACGHWDFPHAQDDLPPELLHAKTEFDYMSATVILGCEPMRRGYITIELLEDVLS